MLKLFALGFEQGEFLRLNVLVPPVAVAHCFRSWWPKFYRQPLVVHFALKASLPAGNAPLHLSVFIPHEDLTRIAFGPAPVVVMFP